MIVSGSHPEDYIWNVFTRNPDNYVVEMKSCPRFRLQWMSVGHEEKNNSPYVLQMLFVIHKL